MYLVEGNIGVGKSTFLDLTKALDRTIDIIPEPVNNWAQSHYGQSLLANFYQDPERWAFTIETLSMVCRARDHVREQEALNKRRIIERSIYSGHYVFALNGKQSGYFTDVEWDIYTKWVNFLLVEHCKVPRGFIYLKASPEVCHRRMLKRSRSSETALTLSYMEKIHEWHTKFLEKKEGLFPALRGVPVLILDCNQDFVAHPEVMHCHVAAIKDFFAQTEGTQKPLSQTITEKISPHQTL